MSILEGKVSLITGAGNGIGRGIALRFAREGSAVGVLDIKAAFEGVDHVPHTPSD